LQRVVSAPGLDGLPIGLQIVATQASGEFPTLPACNSGNNIPDHFENLLPPKLIAKGIDDGRKKTSFDLTPLQNPDLIQFHIAAHMAYLSLSLRRQELRER
jgi:hypothetical protein